MRSKIHLTPAQHAVLAHAIHHAQGRVDWFPKNIVGGARLKVMEGLASRALITQEDDTWFVTGLGYETLGCEHLEPILPRDVPATEPDGASATDAPAPATEARPQPRANSKRARLLDVLQSPTGATLDQMMLLTGWQAHSIRGQLAHIKKAGMNINSVKEDGARIYRVSGR